MQPITDPKKNPLEQSDLIFDRVQPVDVRHRHYVMGTVTVGIVLHDPDLYGLVLSLAGPDAGSLAGLSFELLYKKVTERRRRVPRSAASSGRVPPDQPRRHLDHSRQSSPSTFSRTATSSWISDSRTTGDFTNSFGLEAGIFIGRGGIYFGLLDGSTSSRVPAITNGTFSPVLELGIGLASRRRPDVRERPAQGRPLRAARGDLRRRAGVVPSDRSVEAKRDVLLGAGIGGTHRKAVRHGRFQSHQGVGKRRGARDRHLHLRLVSRHAGRTRRRRLGECRGQNPVCHRVVQLQATAKGKLHDRFKQLPRPGFSRAIRAGVPRNG